MSENTSKNNQKHKRVNDILLGPLERPALAWLVRKLPRWVTPDMLSFLGLFASFLIMFSYFLTNYNKAFLWLASFGFLLNWLGDSLDGNLARYRKIERPRYGFFIDHSFDTITQIAIFIGLGISPYVDLRVACFTLIGYLMMDVIVLINTYVRGIFQISYGKLGPTEVRVIGILVNTSVFFFGNPGIKMSFGFFTAFDLVLAIIAGLFLFFYVTTMIRNATELARLEKR